MMLANGRDEVVRLSDDALAIIRNNRLLYNLCKKIAKCVDLNYPPPLAWFPYALSFHPMPRNVTRNVVFLTGQLLFTAAFWNAGCKRDTRTQRADYSQPGFRCSAAWNTPCNAITARGIPVYFVDHG